LHSPGQTCGERYALTDGLFGGCHSCNLHHFAPFCTTLITLQDRKGNSRLYAPITR
jgi:hypothetical protein